MPFETGELNEETGSPFFAYGRIETDPIRETYLKFTDDGKKVVITAFDHNGKIEEIITREIIKNFNKK